MREAGDSPMRYRSGVDQLASERVKLRCLRLLAEHDEAFNHIREHPPGTQGVRLATTRHKSAIFINDCQRAIAIACISHLSKERADADSLDSALCFRAARRLRQQQSACPVSA